MKEHEQKPCEKKASKMYCDKIDKKSFVTGKNDFQLSRLVREQRRHRQKNVGDKFFKRMIILC